MGAYEISSDGRSVLVKDHIVEQWVRDILTERHEYGFGTVYVAEKLQKLLEIPSIHESQVVSESRD